LEEEQAKQLSQLKGERTNISFGTQIRSYVMHPYQKIKDTRNGYENSKTDMSADCLHEFLVSLVKSESLKEQQILRQEKREVSAQ
jgi:peptide chain release factor 2